jgi:hypothetical protein
MIFKIEIELDVNFDHIIFEVPDDIFEKEKDCLDEYYYIQTIEKCLNNAAVYAVSKDIKDMADDHDGQYKYIKHHNRCEIACAIQIANNAKVTTIKDEK